MMPTETSQLHSQKKVIVIIIMISYVDLWSSHNQLPIIATATASPTVHVLQRLRVRSTASPLGQVPQRNPLDKNNEDI